MPIRVTVWHEYYHEKKHKEVAEIYPHGMHAVIKAGIEEYAGGEVTVRTVVQEDPEHGLTDDVLKNTDVIVWWGHMAHHLVDDKIAQKVANRVHEGMGMVALHSAHYSKPFKLLMGTPCHLKWREAAEKERLWVVAPGHPITAGLGKDYIELEHEEMYGEPFGIPQPEELIFVSWFEGGEIFRSGAVFRRGAGRIFYFRPGHETFRSYYHADVRRVIANGVKYVAPVAGVVSPLTGAPNIKAPLSPIAAKHTVDEELHKPK
jgi:trehalose utilization protein